MNLTIHRSIAWIGVQKLIFPRYVILLQVILYICLRYDAVQGIFPWYRDRCTGFGTYFLLCCIYHIIILEFFPYICPLLSSRVLNMRTFDLDSVILKKININPSLMNQMKTTQSPPKTNLSQTKTNQDKVCGRKRRFTCSMARISKILLFLRC